MFPNALNVGDEIRIIAPSRSLAIISSSVRSLAISRLEKLGLKVTFSKNAEEKDQFDSSSIQSRIDDIHQAFADPCVKGILTTIGGSNSIQLLQQLDYELIKKNPKIFCGYSDITTLQNAIFAKTGLITYSGPHFSTFGCLKGIEYVIDNFHEMFFKQTKEVDLLSSNLWSDDEWYLNQEERTFFPNNGFQIIANGEARGTIIGGNIESFRLLQGTSFMPQLKDAILFMEDNYPMTLDDLDRHLHSLMLLDDFQKVRGLVLGRFQVASKIDNGLLKTLFLSKKMLQGLPIIANADFGHTLPIFTFPIGGNVRLFSQESQVRLTIEPMYNCTV
ncbi:MAG: LD-carboxypeptidase [Rhabdochlamydiaceae bacterium]|nr:LD-carboxypeptidase [Rhabdochlamydiaceae bacterium]